MKYNKIRNHKMQFVTSIILLLVSDTSGVFWNKGMQTQYANPSTGSPH